MTVQDYQNETKLNELWEGIGIKLKKLKHDNIIANSILSYKSCLHWLQDSGPVLLLLPEKAGHGTVAHLLYDHILQYS